MFNVLKYWNKKRFLFSGTGLADTDYQKLSALQR
jgi:hypothetical protein